jgi:predicted metal-dependent peptidase
MSVDLIADVLLAARLARPYYARALTALTPVARPGLGTVAVDRWWRLYYDPAWLQTLPAMQRGMIIAAHEVEHLLRGHDARCRAIVADPRVYNVAGDLEINDDVLSGELPDDALMPVVFGLSDGLTAEEYYTALIDRVEEASAWCSGGSGAGWPLEDELSVEDAPAVSEIDAEILRDQVAADVREHVAQNGRGSVSSGVAIWAEARARRVTIPWSRELTAIVARSSREVAAGRSDWSWSRLSRRFSTVLRPGAVVYRPRIAIIVDTSGSMANDGDEVLGIVRAIINRFGQSEIIQCDAAVTSRSKRSKEWRGGGGTDLRVAIAAAVRFDLIVVVTDGQTPWPDVATVQSCIAILVGSAAADPPSWVKSLRIAGAASGRRLSSEVD